jgi:hypothetical protein
MQELGCAHEDALSLARRWQSSSDATTLPRPRVPYQLQARWPSASLGWPWLPRVRRASGMQAQAPAPRRYDQARTRLERDATRPQPVVSVTPMGASVTHGSPRRPPCRYPGYKFTHAWGSPLCQGRSMHDDIRSKRERSAA